MRPAEAALTSSILDRQQQVYEAMSFDQVLDAVERLPSDEQAALLHIVQRRLSEQARQQLIDDVKQAQREYAEGKCLAGSVDEIMREIES
jgi:hypothetical protein